MKIIGNDGVEYKSIEECMAADLKFEKVLEEKEKAKKVKDKEEKQNIEQEAAEKQKSLKSRKKELAAAIEKAVNDYKEAEKAYEVAKDKAYDRLDAANKVAAKLIEDAKKEADESYNKVETEMRAYLAEERKKLQKASEVKMKALFEFSKEFGPYRTVITGTEALNEYLKTKHKFDSIFNKMFNDWFDV